MSADTLPPAADGFVRAYPPATAPPGPAYYLLFRGSELLLFGDGFRPLDAPPRVVFATTLLFLGTLNGVPCIAARIVDDEDLPKGTRTVGLRGLYGMVSDDEYGLAGYALQILHWRDTYKFCSRCGTETESLAKSWAEKCPECGLTTYPPVSPAVLALVHDGADRVLLAQKEGWGTRYSILAGFVEPGETFEQCVIREVAEEVGVRVENPQYEGSQPWPFPHQIMVGFTCRYADGEIEIDREELTRAAWFHRDELPDLPPPLSLSRQIIDRWKGTPRS